MGGKVNNKFSNLPIGWEVKKLKDVAINCGDYGANAPALPYKTGDVRYIRITDIDDYGHLISEDKASLDETIAQNYLLKDNDILFARTGDTVGKSLLYKSYMGRAAYAGYLIRFTLDEKLILPEYFDAIAKSDIFEAFKISMKRIGAKPNINSREYGIFRFPMPLNLDEQKGIAKLFTKVDEAIASVQNSIAAAERLKKSLMQNLLTGKMKPDGTFRTSKEFYIDEKFGKVPVGWEVKKGTEITTKITKGQSPKWQGFDYQQEGILFVTSENIQNGYIDISKPKYLPLEFNNKIKNSQLKKGDILINIVGASIGRCAIFNIDVECANTNQAVCVFRPNAENDSMFLSLYLQSETTQNRLFRTQVETARANLSLGDFRKFKFVIPQKEEQINIANRINQFNIEIEKQVEGINVLERLKKSLMQNLLTGKIKF